MLWKFFDPQFEYNEKFDDWNLPWTGHRYFAYDLVSNLKPKVIVELGTYFGTSFYSMCQGAKDFNLTTQLNAVDHWQGDPHAHETDPDATFKFVKSIIGTYYSKQNIKLHKMGFDDAVANFKDNSIDILHIDGFHTYEAARHDYDTWKDKVKSDGIIMFHDIKVKEYGVWKVWEEVKKENKESKFIEFEHNFGLGVLVKGGEFHDYLNNEKIIDFVKYYKKQKEFVDNLSELKRTKNEYTDFRNLAEGKIWAQDVILNYKIIKFARVLNNLIQKIKLGLKIKK